MLITAVKQDHIVLKSFVGKMSCWKCEISFRKNFILAISAPFEISAGFGRQSHPLIGISTDGLVIMVGRKCRIRATINIVSKSEDEQFPETMQT